MRVKYFPYQPHCFAFGGFDMQMLNALEAVRKAGVDASKLDIWSRDNDFEIIHLWGISPHNYQIIDWAKKGGKVIVATVLLPYFASLRLKLSYYKNYFSQKELIQYFNKIDKIVVVNDLQAEVLTKYYRFPPHNIEIIPNIVEDKYFEIPTLNFSATYNINNYILCTGNISARKNQYNLAVACLNLNLSLVLIGNILDGETLYGKSLEALIINNSKNIKWIKELPSASEELTAAYYNCLIYALPSHDETQPISALEAVAMRRPLILMDKRYAYQGYYKDAILCKSPSIKDIEIALQQCLFKENTNPVNNEIINCRERNVGMKYKAIYEKSRQDSYLGHEL
jgi:glycosyltransferase involved in cell wall biosynthesis